MAGSNPAEIQALLDLLKVGPLSGLVGGRGQLGRLGRLGQSLAGSDVVKAIVIWQLLGEAISPALAPLVAEIEQTSWGQFPGKVLAPADLADAVVRSHIAGSRGESEAAQSGIDAERFRILVANTGEPPGLQELLELWRRGLLEEAGEGAEATSVEQGIREGRLQNKWIPALKALREVHLPPEALADMVVRAVRDLDAAAAEAAFSGIDGARFRDLVANAGEPLPLQEAMQAWRRGIIQENGTGADAVSLEQIIRESRLKTKYLDAVKALQWVPLSARDWVAAWLRGQVSEAEALAGARVEGVTEADARILYNASGRPPSPTELMVLLHRGLIPLEGTGPDVKSFQQGIFEGDTKDKWWREYAALAEHIPPPRSIVAMVRSGAMDDETARRYLQQSGLSPALAATYIAEAHHTKTQSARDLTTQQVLSAYGERLVTAEVATAMLVKLRWSQENAALLLQERDAAQARSQLNSAITRTRSLYIAHRITTEETRKALAAYQLPPAAIDQYVRTWTLERRENVKLLTQAEIAWAFSMGYLSEEAALAELEASGYSPRDAWIVLSHHGKKDLSAKMPPQTSPGDELSPAR